MSQIQVLPTMPTHPFDSEEVTSSPEQVLAASKKKIQRSKNACTACHKSRAKCDGGTPCSRCVRIGNDHQCEPFAGKKRGRKSGFTLKNHATQSNSSISLQASKESFGLGSPEGSDTGLHSSSSSSPSSLDQMQPMTPGVVFPNFSTFDPLGFSFEGYTQFPGSSPYQPDYYGTDALVPSFTAKDVILKSNPKPFIPPSVNLRKDSRKLIYICSATESFATLVGRSHRDVEGSPFRDFVPRRLYKACLMSWFQKYTELHDKGQTTMTFKNHTLLMGSNSIIPVEISSIVVDDPTGEISIIRMDFLELTTTEALSVGLPIFDPDLDSDNPADDHCENVLNTCTSGKQGAAAESEEMDEENDDCTAG